MNRPEEALQRQVVAFLRHAAPDCIWFAVPNGGWRSKAEAGILKATGVKAGVADLVFILPGAQARFMELKAPRGRSSTDQRAFAATCERLGAPYLIVTTLAEAQGALDAWGVQLRARIAA